MIQECKRMITRERGEPKRQLREIHSEDVLVDAVELDSTRTGNASYIIASAYRRWS